MMLGWAFLAAGYLGLLVIVVALLFAHGRRDRKD